MKYFVTVINTGTANIASMTAALNRLGAEAEITAERRKIERAQLLVLPGVGAFAAAMKRLEEAGLIGLIKSRIAQQKPLLAVCLGLQLLAETSEESEGCRGISVYPLSATRFTGGLRVPQMGWNEIAPQTGCRLLKPGYAYFANSYCLRQAPEGVFTAHSDYGGPFVAAFERGSLLACQFHPELSGKWGLNLIQDWLDFSIGKGDRLC